MSERASAIRVAYDTNAKSVTVEPRRATSCPKRPLGVTFVAIFQIFKGAVLMGIALLLHWRPDIIAASRASLHPVLYIVTRGKLSIIDGALRGPAIVTVLLFVFGFYLAVVGSGLWRLRKLARRTVLVTCSITLLLWLRTKVDTGFVGQSGVSTASPEINSFHALLLLDGLVFLYLVRTNIGQQFKSK